MTQFLAKIFLLVLGATSAHVSAEKNLKPRVRDIVKIPDNFKTMRPNIGATHFAFEAEYEKGLFLYDMRKNLYRKILDQPVFGNYVWSWDSENLFFAQIVKSKKKKKKFSSIWALHVRSGTKKLLHRLPGPISKLVFNQKGQTLSFLTAKGPLAILTNSTKKYAQPGPWIVTDTSILARRSYDGQNYGKYKTIFSGEKIMSFDFNKAQNSIVWSTKSEQVYQYDLKSKSAKKLGKGRHPSFHPFMDLVLVSRARLQGNQVRDNDLALLNANGKSAYLTNSQGEAENGAAWHPDGTKVFYAKSGSTKLELLDFQM
jgi:Tol biopolymer transport system component